jgi:hypothetical protein
LLLFTKTPKVPLQVPLSGVAIKVRELARRPGTTARKKAARRQLLRRPTLRRPKKRDKRAVPVKHEYITLPVYLPHLLFESLIKGGLVGRLSLCSTNTYDFCSTLFSQTHMHAVRAFRMLRAGAVDWVQFWQKVKDTESWGPTRACNFERRGVWWRAVVCGDALYMRYLPFRALIEESSSAAFLPARPVAGAGHLVPW